MAEYYSRQGHIANAYFGLGGYAGLEIGIHLSLNFPGHGGVWEHRAWFDANQVKEPKHGGWKEADRNKYYADLVRCVSDYLRDAKVSDITELRGKPIQGEFRGRELLGWEFIK